MGTGLSSTRALTLKGGHAPSIRGGCRKDTGVSRCPCYDLQWTFCAVSPTRTSPRCKPHHHRREWEHCLKFQGQDGPWFYVFDLKPGLRPPDLPGRQDRGGLLGPGSPTCTGPQQTLGEEGLLLAPLLLIN